MSREVKFKVIHADISDRLPKIREGRFDAVLCDPPYGLGFMGKEWDKGVPGKDIWSMVARTMKPGAHLVAFGGTRTFHRLACAIEDAGLEIRDCLSWLYGSGFPKSLNISKAIDRECGKPRDVQGRGEVVNRTALDFGGATGKAKNGLRSEYVRDDVARTEDGKQWIGWGTALKPAWEPCILAMKPTRGTFAANALEFGVAGLNVDGGRTSPGLGGAREGEPSASRRYSERGAVTLNMTPGPRGGSSAGRWPANLILDEEAAAMLDEQSGAVGGGFGVSGGNPDGAIYGRGFPRGDRRTVGFGDSGGASRFFYCAKASRKEREAGLESFDVKLDGGVWGDLSEGKKRTIPVANHHPTVKPIDLCRYLAKLLLPPERETPRRILVPFSGSGSEMIGAMLAGWDAITGIEKESAYVEISNARLAYYSERILSNGVS